MKPFFTKFVVSLLVVGLLIGFLGMLQPGSNMSTLGFAFFVTVLAFRVLERRSVGTDVLSSYADRVHPKSHRIREQPEKGDRFVSMKWWGGIVIHTVADVNWVSSTFFEATVEDSDGNRRKYLPHEYEADSYKWTFVTSKGLDYNGFYSHNHKDKVYAEYINLLMMFAGSRVPKDKVLTAVTALRSDIATTYDIGHPLYGKLDEVWNKLWDLPSNHKVTFNYAGEEDVGVVDAEEYETFDRDDPADTKKRFDDEDDEAEDDVFAIQDSNDKTADTQGMYPVLIRYHGFDYDMVVHEGEGFLPGVDYDILQRCVGRIKEPKGLGQLLKADLWSSPTDRRQADNPTNYPMIVHYIDTDKPVFVPTYRHLLSNLPFKVITCNAQSPFILNHKVSDEQEQRQEESAAGTPEAHGTTGGVEPGEAVPAEPAAHPGEVQIGNITLVSADRPE